MKHDKFYNVKHLNNIDDNFNKPDKLMMMNTMVGIMALQFVTLFHRF